MTHWSNFECDGKGQITAFLYTLKQDSSYHLVTSSNKPTKFKIIHGFADYISFLCVRKFARLSLSHQPLLTNDDSTVCLPTSSRYNTRNKHIITSLLQME